MHSVPPRPVPLAEHFEAALRIYTWGLFFGGALVGALLGFSLGYHFWR